MRLTLLSVAFAAALPACSQPAATTADTPAPAAAPAEADARSIGVQLDAPQAGARVTSPLAVTGTAPAGWYFENQFPVSLVNAQGNTIAQAPATPRVNWTANADPKQFDVSLVFNVTIDTPATLVLQEDMPQEGAPPRELRIPVVLAPRIQ
jgi:Immunoglobulin-like domain of bacterial spore germination